MTGGACRGLLRLSASSGREGVKHGTHLCVGQRRILPHVRLRSPACLRHGPCGWSAAIRHGASERDIPVDPLDGDTRSALVRPQAGPPHFDAGGHSPVLSLPRAPGPLPPPYPSWL
ncbi:hypothetical protein Q5P01_019844 [Channa striata]|uniref:Uncharacterized protein n=1 Tax=Channa striata TaxID=64152 RepID=A0AA88M1R3_CHASR|nr:hypothetical protein Q5P01_019844 [Channa striata]